MEMHYMLLIYKVYFSRMDNRPNYISESTKAGSAVSPIESSKM